MILKKISELIENINKIKVGGDIKYYNLENWWFNELSKEERILIKNKYSPLNSSHSIDEGKILNTNCSKVGFLKSLLGWFKPVEDFDLANKILKKGESLINNETNALDKHFLYLKGIELYYANKDFREDAIEKTIHYCKKQISISKDVKKSFIKEYKNSNLPSHRGYNQLVIIYERQGNYDEAIEIASQALLEGWSGDWKQRLNRLQRLKSMN